jgi:hypothetical protein
MKTASKMHERTWNILASCSTTWSRFLARAEAFGDSRPRWVDNGSGSSC